MPACVLLFPPKNECVTTKVCVPGMEHVCTPMVCECASGMQCARLRARVTGHKPVCLCVSLGVSQSGFGCGALSGWGVHGVEDRAYRRSRGQELLMGPGFWWAAVSRHPLPQGWAPGAQTRCLLLPLPLTHWLTKISLAGGFQPGPARKEQFRAPRWWGLFEPSSAGSRRGRAAAPARGEARPRGPRAPRQAARASPLPPRLLRGAHPSTGRGAPRSRPAPNAPTACAPARERYPAVSASPSPQTLSRAPAESLRAKGPRPRPPNLWGPGRRSLAQRPR